MGLLLIKIILMVAFSLDWGSYIPSIPNTASKKMGTLICSLNFFSFEGLLHLYEFTIRSYKEYYSHVWVGAPNCYHKALHGILAMPGLVLLIATWVCWIIYRDRYVKLLIIDLLHLLNHWLFFKM